MRGIDQLQFRKNFFGICGLQPEVKVTAMVPEALARQVLSIFVDGFSLDTGGNLPLRNVQSVWIQYGHTTEQLRIALQCACRLGWLLENIGTESYQLTDIGRE